MTIVLPHGVLFRGGEEGKIRKQLIEQNHIDTIIGLPANIFFGTGIPTVILVLKQKRLTTDVLVIDASKHFIKEGKSNKLQASDIKRITDTVIHRQSIAKFSTLVSKETLQANDYNLNIPRYVDSSEATPSWDLHATMMGGIPNSEIDGLREYWQAFPQLHSTLYAPQSKAYSTLAIEKQSVHAHICAHPQVVAFMNAFTQAFEGFDDFLNTQLIQNWQQVNRNQAEESLSVELFKRLSPIALIDKYQAYQLLSNQWRVIAADIEMMQTEGFRATTQVDPNIVIKKKDGKDTEVQEGYKGHILPFELVQQTYLSEELAALTAQENRLAEITSRIEEIIESLTEEEKDLPILNDKNDSFVKAELNKKINDIYSIVDSVEINTLKKYLKLLNDKAKKPEKLNFIKKHSQVQWVKIIAGKDGLYSKTEVNNYLQSLRTEFVFEPDSFEGKVVQADQLVTEQTGLKADIKAKLTALNLKTKATIEDLSEEQVYILLHLKWIAPLCHELATMPHTIMTRLTNQVQALADKYAETYAHVAKEIQQAEQELADMIGELTGNAFDMQGLEELSNLLRGK